MTDTPTTKDACLRENREYVLMPRKVDYGMVERRYDTRDWEGEDYRSVQREYEKWTDLGTPVPSAALAAPLAEGAVKVRDLEWKIDGTARPFGMIYIVSIYRNPLGDGRKTWLCGVNGQGIGNFSTKEEARAAAQADYSARILASLSIQPLVSGADLAVLGHWTAILKDQAIVDAEALQRIYDALAVPVSPVKEE